MSSPVLRADPDWISAHLYYQRDTALAGGIYEPACDSVVRDWVAPIIASLRGDGYSTCEFFVRYANRRGSHVRLRVRPSADTATDKIRERIERAAIDRCGAQSLEWAAYEPEYTRYGGKVAIAVAERCFAASSQLAIGLLAGLHSEARSARLGRGLVAMLALIHAFLPVEADAGAFADSYCTGYLQTVSGGDAGVSSSLREAFDAGYMRQADLVAEQVRHVWTLLSTSGEREPTIDRWYADACTVRAMLADLCAMHGIELVAQNSRDWGACVWHILPSYVHMTNNRLGVALPEESYLARLISRTLLSAAS